MKINSSPHKIKGIALRRKFATRLIKLTGNIALVRKLLQHK